MNIFYIILVIVIVGVLLYLINRLIPMAGGIKTLLNVVVLLLLIIWLLQVFSLIPIIVPFSRM